MAGTRRAALAGVAAALCVVMSACSPSAAAPSPRPRSVDVTTRPTAATPTRWQHVVVVMEENHAVGQVIGSPSAPYFNHLASTGADFTQFYAETHPSEPNYVALFSGSTHGVTDDSCPLTFTGDNLGHQLLASGRTFAGYSEGLPRTGSQVCTSGEYARKHSPWVDFSDLPSSVNRPLTALPTDYAKLPTVSFVIPDLQHDMHDGTVAQADSWLRSHLGAYARWAVTHHSLLVVTWDEDDDTSVNRIPTVAVGAGVTRGPSRQHVTHYALLRTLEDAFGMRHLGQAASATGIRALGG